MAVTVARVLHLVKLALGPLASGAAKREAARSSHARPRLETLLSAPEATTGGGVVVPPHAPRSGATDAACALLVGGALGGAVVLWSPDAPPAVDAKEKEKEGDVLDPAAVASVAKVLTESETTWAAVRGVAAPRNKEPEARR